MKRVIALTLCVLLGLAALTPAAGATFTDISDPGTALAAAALQGMGVLSGTSEGVFNPSGTLTRAQVCVMAVNAAGLSRQVSTYARRTMFSDVPASAWYNGYVNLAYSEGLVSGNGDGTFSPDRAVTWGELATILLRMLGYTSAEVGTVWPLDYTGFCDDLGLTDGLSLGAYEAVTRGEAAVLFYRTLKTTVNGSDQPYYATLGDVASTGEAILLDADASSGGSNGLLMVYDLEGDGVAYHTPVYQQSETLEGSMGVLLFDSSGQVIGFLPSDGDTLDQTIQSATASSLTDASGESHRISSGAVVIAGGETYPYSTSGYLQLSSRTGRTVRLYYDDDGSVAYLYLSGGAAASAEAAVATAASAGSLARALDLTASDYSITKNGAAADSGDVAQYDVGYYEAATNTLRVSDYRVTGYLSSASPSVAAATTVTVAGCTFDVLECAWETLGEFALGDRVTLLLTDDCQVAAACDPSEVTAEMIGVLSEDGASVTLAGSGIVLTAETVSGDASARGGLVTVRAGTASRLYCSSVSSSSARRIDLESGTLGTMELAPSLAVYERPAEDCYVYDLEGNRGSWSTDFDAMDWTDTISSSDVAYYHVNSAGQVDIILLEDVTGNCYAYGEFSFYSGSEGINLGASGLNAYNRAATLTNSDGTSEKFLCSLSVSGSNLAGAALGRYSESYERAAVIQRLTAQSGVSADAFYQQDSDWYVEADGQEFPVSDQLQVRFDGADLWLSGEEGLTAALADDYALTLYYDRPADEGGQIRIIVAK